MTREQYAEYAASLKPQGMNCAQSVIKALESFIGPDAEVLVKGAAGLGGGMGCMESTCGALIGASMIAAHRLGGRDAILASRDMLKEFEKQCGATLCKDLKTGNDGKALCTCPVCVMNATKIVIDALGLECDE